MEKQLIDQLANFEWMPSRIPVRDALVAFVPHDKDNPPAIETISARIGESRWFPKADGIQAVFPYDRKEYDDTVFHIEKGGWNYNECHANILHFIPAMTLCYVTKYNPYILLCAECYEQHVTARSNCRSQ